MRMHMVGGSRNFAGMLQKWRLVQACVYLLQAWASPPRQCDQKESFDPSHDYNGPTSNIGLNDGRYEQGAMILKVYKINQQHVKSAFYFLRLPHIWICYQVRTRTHSTAVQQ